MSLKKNDPRVKMYKEARAILAEAITFTPEERPAKLQIKKACLEKTRDNQVFAAGYAAHTMGQASRVQKIVEELYAKELEDIEAEIEELTSSETQ